MNTRKLDAAGVKRLLGVQKSAPFPRRFETLPPDVFQSYFYSTQSEDSYSKPVLNPGTSLGDYQGTNVKPIHGPNGITKEMYMDETNRAPLWRREMCEYVSTYIPKPLDGVSVNSDIRELVKEKQRDSSLKGPGNEKLAGASQTTSRSIHCPFPQDHALRALQATARPVQDNIQTDREAKINVHKSRSQADLPWFDQEKARRSRGESCKPYRNAQVKALWLKEASNYTKNFTAPTTVNVMESLGHSASSPELHR